MDSMLEYVGAFTICLYCLCQAPALLQQVSDYIPAGEVPQAEKEMLKLTPTAAVNAQK